MKKIMPHFFFSTSYIILLSYFCLLLFHCSWGFNLVSFNGSFQRRGHLKLNNILTATPFRSLPCTITSTMVRRHQCRRSMTVTSKLNSSPNNNISSRLQPIRQDDSKVCHSRRDWVVQSSSLISIFTTTSSTFVLGNNNKAAHAVVMDNSSENARTFVAGEKLGKDAALSRFRKAREDLNYLLQNFDTIVSNGGGDNVRRYLGTVGVTSALYGITKVLKELQEEADDIVTFTESMNDFDYYLRAADTACYSANFVEFSAAKTKPEKFFEDAKRDTQNMKITLDRMASELRIQ